MEYQPLLAWPAATEEDGSFDEILETRTEHSPHLDLRLITERSLRTLYGGMFVCLTSLQRFKELFAELS